MDYSAIVRPEMQARLLSIMRIMVGLLVFPKRYRQVPEFPSRPELRHPHTRLNVVVGVESSLHACSCIDRPSVSARGRPPSSPQAKWRWRTSRRHAGYFPGHGSVAVQWRTASVFLYLASVGRGRLEP